MNLIRIIVLSLFIFTQVQADTIYNLIKIPNLEIYNTKTPNKLRYLYAKQPFTIGVDNNINCYSSKKNFLEENKEFPGSIILIWVYRSYKYPVNS